MGLNWSKNDDSDDDFYSEDEEEEIGEDSKKDEEYQSPEEVVDLLENICLDSATDTTDAVPPTSTMTISLTLSQVEKIENLLDVYEKVSVIYLLYEEPTSTLDVLLKLISGCDEKGIYNWCLFQNVKNTKWQEQLIEAICIIKNFEVLRLLGFNREELRVRFLPHHAFTSAHVNKIRKFLYFMCEDFEQKDVETLLSLICADFKTKGFDFKVHNLQYLELYLLHWEAIGYLKHDNLSNLCSILKHMDQLDLCDKLKELVPVSTPIFKKQEKKNVDSKKSEKFCNDILSTSSLLSLVSMGSNNSADNAGSGGSIVSEEANKIVENKYDVDPNTPGVCLIINQENFYREIDPNFKHLLPSNKLDSRIGTEYDKERLVKTFKKFGFRVVTADNLIHCDIIKKIEEVIKQITKDSSFFVCIMSHGDEGVIYGVNSCRVPVKDIKGVMCKTNREHLSGKPKVLILQSCQGTRCQPTSSADQDDDITTDGPPTSHTSSKLPIWSDLFTFWATVPGYAAIRNKKTGSWFIQSFCENMKALGDKQHFEDICIEVCHDVTNKKWRQTNEEVAMTPLREGTFRKKFYLPSVRTN